MPQVLDAKHKTIMIIMWCIRYTTVANAGKQCDQHEWRLGSLSRTKRSWNVIRTKIDTENLRVLA